MASSSSSASFSANYVVPGIWIVSNVVTSVGIILINKVLMTSFKFKWVFTLTALHFLVTAIGMEVLALLNFFNRARLPAKEAALMALFCIGSVAFMNFSLLTNSVGLYQIFKLLCIPVMVAIQTLLYGQTFSFRVRSILVVILLGVGIATVTDVQANAEGLFMGALAVLFTAQFQIWQGDKQKVFHMNAMQMNHSQALPAFLVCAILAFFFDCSGVGEENVLYHRYKENELLYIFMSCVLALTVNLCSYGLIGATSPVTYQVVGHSKTCLILIGGYLMSPPTDSVQLMKNLIGIFIAMFGVIVYSNIKLAESSKSKDWIDLYVCPPAQTPVQESVELLGKEEEKA